MPSLPSSVASRLPAWLSSAAFAAVSAVLVAADRVPAPEGAWIAVSVAVAFGVTGWFAPVGWKRRAAEASLIPVAAAMLLVADLTIRRMLVPPLAAAAAAAAVLAALAATPRQRQPLLWAALGVATRAAAGVGLAGAGLLPTVAAFAASAIVPWAAGAWGARAGLMAGMVVAAVPLQQWPLAAVGSMLVALWWLPWARSGARRSIATDGWLTPFAAVALVGAAVAAYGGVRLTDGFPGLGVAGLAVVAAALVITWKMPAGAAGAVWFLAALALGPPQLPAPELQAFRIEHDSPRAVLPAGDGGPYLLDIGVRGGRKIPDGTRVAVVEGASGERPIRVGVETAEGVRRRAGSEVSINHGLPHRPVWRPMRVGTPPMWRVSGRVALEVAAGDQPIVRLAPGLPPETVLVVEAAGPSVPTPPRRLMLQGWLWAAAGIVVLLQLGAGSWRSPTAVVPWALLLAGQIVARLAVEPLRLVGERHAVDLAMAALLAAWVPAAWSWLSSRRVALAFATLLVPLAVATPSLTPPLYGDEPFHLHVMESLSSDRDLDLTNNLDIDRNPGDRLYALGTPLLHSPLLGMLLLPGWLLAGRAGALALLALAGAGMAALLAARCRQLGVSEHRLPVLLMVVAVTYPLATFSTQIWPEVIGLLAVAAILVAAAARPARGWLAVLAAAVAAAVKTRLGLITFPAAAVACWRGRRFPGWASVAALVVAATGSLGVGWLFMGHPFGYFRRVEHLVPSDLSLAARVVGGLAFDPAGGLLFSAPLMLVSALLVGLLWQRGGAAERAVVVGGALTLLALLHSKEWYGGGAPPARYLVPLLPAAVLSWGLAARTPLRWRRFGETLLAPSIMIWWALITRPHLSINPGDGRWWLSDALARRLAADTQYLVPSFLVPTPATLWLPAVAIAAAVVVLLCSRRPSSLRLLVRSATALWLALAAAVTAAVVFRFDRSVEVEAAHVRRLGGVAVPPAGTFSRYEHRRGWMVRDGDAVVVPLNVAAGASVWLDGWLLGTAQPGAELVVRWDKTEPGAIEVAGDQRTGRVRLPDPPGPGRHLLRIGLRAPPGGGAVLDRVELSW